MANFLLIKYPRCPLCQGIFTNYSSAYDEVNSETCRKDTRNQDVPDDHTYIQSVPKDTDEVIRMIVRVGDGDSRFYLRANRVGSHYTQIWKGKYKSSDIVNSVVIENKVIQLNYDNGIDNIIKQLKVYLAFS